MARPLRIEASGMWYHIMNRGVLRKEIFVCDEDYQRFLKNLTDNCDKFNVEIHSYVLMPNHFHFFLRTNEANLSRFMHRQLTSYTNWFNLKYERVGHLFQGRYKSIIIDNNNYGIEITRYIHLNPVRTKENLELNLREKRKLLKTYRWSSFPAMVGIKSPLPFLFVNETLERFGDEYKEQRKNYIYFIEEGLKRDLDNPLEKTVAQSVLGSEPFVREIQSINKTGNKIDKEHNEKSRDEIRGFISLPIEKIFEVVCKGFDVDKQSILTSSRGRRDILPRQITFYLAAKYCVGIMTFNKIGKIMGCKNGSSVSKAVKRIKELSKKDQTLTNKLKQLEDGVRNGFSFLINNL